MQRLQIVARRMRTLLIDRRAATMAEYAILIAVIAVVVIAAARVLGTSVSGNLNRSATSIGGL